MFGISFARSGNHVKHIPQVGETESLSCDSLHYKATCRDRVPLVPDQAVPDKHDGTSCSNVHNMVPMVADKVVFFQTGYPFWQTKVQIWRTNCHFWPTMYVVGEVLVDKVHCRPFFG